MKGSSGSCPTPSPRSPYLGGSLEQMNAGSRTRIGVMPFGVPRPPPDRSRPGKLFSEPTYLIASRVLAFLHLDSDPTQGAFRTRR